MKKIEIRKFKTIESYSAHSFPKLIPKPKKNVRKNHVWTNRKDNHNRRNFINENASITGCTHNLYPVHVGTGIRKRKKQNI